MHCVGTQSRTDWTWCAPLFVFSVSLQSDVLVACDSIVMRTPRCSDYRMVDTSLSSAQSSTFFCGMRLVHDEGDDHAGNEREESDGADGD